MFVLGFPDRPGPHRVGHKAEALTDLGIHRRHKADSNTSPMRHIRRRSLEGLGPFSRARVSESTVHRRPLPDMTAFRLGGQPCLGKGGFVGLYTRLLNPVMSVAWCGSRPLWHLCAGASFVSKWLPCMRTQEDRHSIGHGCRRKKGRTPHTCPFTFVSHWLLF